MPPSRGSRDPSRTNPPGTRLLAGLAFLAVVALVVWGRFVQIRDLALPPWVDSVHHSALVRLVLAHGGPPATYRPYAEADSVYYHLGYHLLVAALVRLLHLEVERAMLLIGQVLNALACVSLAVLAARWTRRSAPALAALVVPGAISSMPSEYLAWGRYTQLTGLVILPLAMAVTDRAIEAGRRRDLLLAGALVAALFVVHYRVLAFWGTFLVAHLAVRAAAGWPPRRTDWGRAAAVVLIALALGAPWLYRVLSTAVFPLHGLAARFAFRPEGAEGPVEILAAGTMPPLLAMAAGSTLLVLARGHRTCRPVLVILVWVVLTVALHNPARLGLPPVWILDNFSMAIAAYVPVSLLIACGLAAALEAVETRFPRQAGRVRIAAHVALPLVAAWGAPGLAHVVNPGLVLASSDDVEALRWIRHHTPADARFLVNARAWFPPIYAGTDAGYWIPHLTGRRTTMPIVFYVLGRREYWHDEINGLGRMVEAGVAPDDPDFLAAVRRRGVTHVYIGTRGGPLSLARLSSSPRYERIHQRGAAHVFRLRE